MKTNVILGIVLTLTLIGCSNTTKIASEPPATSTILDQQEPDKPYTKRAAETRMGKGKGPVEYWVAVVKPGRIMFEVAGTDQETAKRALLRAKYKLSVKTKIVSRDVAGEA